MHDWKVLVVNVIGHNDIFPKRGDANGERDKERKNTSAEHHARKNSGAPIASNFLAFKSNAPFGCLMHARDGIEQCGLASAVGPDQREHFAALHLK